MARELGKGYEQIRESLTQLDLHHHSLNNIAQRLVPEAPKPLAASSGALYEQALQLSKDCFRIIHDLCDHLDKEDLDSCQSMLDRVDLAVHRASEGKTPTLCMANVWRVIEATEQFLGAIADKYNYARLSEEMAWEAMEDQESKAAEMANLFAEYKKAMATKVEAPKPAGPPFSHGILYWRGSQLLYVQRIQDGARWIEVDPDCERDGVIDEEEAVKLVQTRTIEGYPITLRLDLMVDEMQVDKYIHSAMGSEYLASGSQIAKGKRGRDRKGRRR